MPYIDQEARTRFNPLLIQLHTIMAYGIAPGELNYIMTKLAHSYMETKGLNYAHLNDVVGVFESAKAEFQRQVVNPYEDKKIKENGGLDTVVVSAGHELKPMINSAFNRRILENGDVG